ncbi:ABC transporter permease [Caldisalinibacter kiritimatiensis]|uniref:Spermidine Putrescine ABC transporter permease component PotB n=1 Tax=Caldisalinibacter kiritimatiensis TaxID=1304284 RepID=R1ATG6_9FIRM|nr:ABC transporter permease [Caldisalinibacter kiritimatiensis]EOC99921.1 Spermidine Putrescine ABC transporter permease component PotB [Caldisalinibacter kiritimatiensis]
MRKRYISYPYILWIIVFILVPLLLVLYFSLTTKDFETGAIKTSFENYKRFLDPIYLKVLGRSINLALIATFICLILGYPMAIIISKADISKRNIMVLLFVVPMWMNFLLRTYAWMTLLGRNGIINGILDYLGLQKLNLLYNSGAVILGMVYNFLPFMVLPIYSVLNKIDKSVIEAAEDLGANKNIIFRKVIFPLSLPGVISGITMVFMPAVSTFVISRLLGGGQYMLIGNLVEQQFLYVGDWHFGSAISVVMMIMILISMAIMSRYDKKQEGGGLW